VRFHAQNLNERKHRPNGWILRYGRCWLDILTMKWNFCWVVGGGSWRDFAVELSIADPEDELIGGHVRFGWLCAFFWGLALPHGNRLKRFVDRITSRAKEPRHYGPCIFCAYLEEGHTALEPIGAAVPDDGKIPFNRREKCCPNRLTIYRGANSYWPTNGRTIGIKFYEEYLWIDLWNDPSESHRVDPWWWHISINLRDLFFGRAKYQDNPLETCDVIVPMPEGGYRGKAVLSESTWSRPRWFTKRVIRVNIEMTEPIPFPGKGENGYDCGQDACHSICTPAETILEGVLSLTESVMRNRQRYGGSAFAWRPEVEKTA
jgi:hypothetical protein